MHKSIHIFLLRQYQILCFLYYCRVKKLGFIQELIGKKIVSFKAKRHVRVTRAHNLDSAKTIGIIFDANDQNTHKKVVEFTDILIKKHALHVETIGFVSNKNLLTVFQGQVGFLYCTKHDFSWYGTARSKFLQDFITKDFDILINTTTAPSYPFEYITQLSNAHFRVGQYTETTKNHDLMIDIRKDKTIEYLITQILVYLSMIQVSKT